MEQDKKKIQEPFEPEDTPKPPQIIEPNSGRDRENPIKDEKRESKAPGEKSPADEKHLLSEDSDISDDTTI